MHRCEICGTMSTVEKDLSRGCGEQHGVMIVSCVCVFLVYVDHWIRVRLELLVCKRVVRLRQGTGPSRFKYEGSGACVREFIES